LFAGAVLAFSLLGSMHPHYWNTENGRYHENFVNQIRVRKNNDGSCYRRTQWLLVSADHQRLSRIG